MSRYSPFEFVWHCVGVLAALLLICLLIWFTVADKPVRGYYLSEGYRAGFVIGVDIDNWEDPAIPCTGLTFWEAAAVVDSLNKTLR